MRSKCSSSEISLPSFSICSSSPSTICWVSSFKVAVQERNFRILDALIELTQQMVEGELLQMEKLGKLISLDEHFDLIYRKTACLFSVCMRLGAILGG